MTDVVAVVVAVAAGADAVAGVQSCSPQYTYHCSSIYDAGVDWSPSYGNRFEQTLQEITSILSVNLCQSFAQTVAFPLLIENRNESEMESFPC